MRRLWRWIKRGLLALLLVVLALLTPVAWTEVNCRGTKLDSRYAAILPPADHRPESRTLMTYPEWHIVHAYEDYAAVIATGAPQDYAFLPAIGQYWTSLCTLTEAAAALWSHKTAKWFLILFGAAYLAYGVLGLVTGVGYLDLAICTTGPIDLPFGFKILANTPHIGLGGFALIMGLRA